MDGDFKGDFSRDSFDFLYPFSRILMQQGRVQLDADWNEQADSLLYYLRTLAMNVIGPVGGRGTSFKIDHMQDKNKQAKNDDDFTIGAGHYYVDGILCTNDVDAITYKQQPYNPQPEPLSQQKPGNYLVYLDAWERQVTALENDSIREVALGAGGPDTATRGQIVWQVKVTDATPFEKFIEDPMTVAGILSIKNALMEQLQPSSRGRLLASTDDNPATPPDPCSVAPDARYRGEENQLYRVEIHTGSTPASASTVGTSTSKTSARSRARGKNVQQVTLPDGPTFKWSRENGSVVFPIFGPIQNNTDGTVMIPLDNLGRDNNRFTLNKNDWVELLTPASSLRQTHGQMLQVSKIDYTLMQVICTLPGGGAADPVNAFIDATKDEKRVSDNVPRFLLRLWNHHAGNPERGGLTIAKDGAAQILEDRPLSLENGIQVTFTRSPLVEGTIAYRTGDYWLIPARTTTGSIQWPDGKLLLPHGVSNYYAPLAFITLKDSGEIEAGSSIPDLRSTFKWLTELTEEISKQAKA